MLSESHLHSRFPGDVVTEGEVDAAASLSPSAPAEVAVAHCALERLLSCRVTRRKTLSVVTIGPNMIESVRGGSPAHLPRISSMQDRGGAVLGFCRLLFNANE